MKNWPIFIFAIALLLWAIGAMLLYDKDSSNAAITVSGLVIVAGFAYHIRKKAVSN